MQFTIAPALESPVTNRDSTFGKIVSAKLAKDKLNDVLAAGFPFPNVCDPGGCHTLENPAALAHRVCNLVVSVFVATICEDSLAMAGRPF